MELYYGRYRNYIYISFSKKWIYGDTKSIIVIANSLSEARLKVERCLSEFANKDCHPVLVEMIKCAGLTILEDSLFLEPIVDEIEAVTE